ncbi:MAG: hypothetical protein K0Q72_3665 [Armatimonadetes bacterium]|jgi:sialic acid synthase SpsE|nr:hypothetical protein [Armatimonadota bacterium]
MNIGNIDLDQEVLVIAEIGNNHEGSFEVAQELVRQAAAAGVGAVKFQTFRAEHYVSQSDGARFARLQGFQLTYEQFAELADLARSLGVLFISTPFDLGSADFLGGIVDALKVASGDNDFYPLIDRCVAAGKPLIVSTGVSDLAKVNALIDYVRAAEARHGVSAPLVILHCVSAYPVSPEQASLRAIPVLARETGCTVGYSDHTIGTDAACLAVALGARIVEKHFTLDKNYSDFRDHQLSSDPAEMKLLVEKIKQTSAMLGADAKEIQAGEAPVASAIRRSIVAGGDFEAGHVLRFEDLTWIRPAGGLVPGQEELLVGKTLQRAVGFGERLAAEDVA